jgi:MscS family membrane protein
MSASKINMQARLSVYSAPILCLLLLCALGNPAGATGEVNPLAPPDTTSPRATITTFLDEMNSAVAAYLANRRPEARGHAERAVRCLNLEKVPPAISDIVGIYSSLYLKETLDRIKIPPLEQIPDAKALESQKTVAWILPETEITIAAVKDESGIERYLFTPDTVKHSELFYNKVKLLPYISGGKGALYEKLVSSGGVIFPKRFIERLPPLAKVKIFGQAVWQWFGLAVFFLLGMAMVFLVYRYGRGALAVIDEKVGWDLRNTIGGLVLPVALIFFAQSGLHFIVYGLHLLQGDVYVPVAFIFLSISYFGIIWLIGALLDRAATLVIALGGFESGGMQAPLVRFCFDVITVIIVIVTALNLGARLGLPTYSLVAGLGIGGLAVALAGRETLSNLIGTIMILVDQPFRLGDFVVLGEGDRGAVTEIGLRSTRIRTRDGILVSVPNSNVANMKIVNESAPVTEARIHVPVGAAYGSSLEEVEHALLSACKRCEYLAPEPPPSVRLVRFGDSALEFELFAWIIRPEFRGRATNQLNRVICDEFRKFGIEMPFPQRDIHMRADKKPEKE